jgi:hypothetical protein
LSLKDKESIRDRKSTLSALLVSFIGGHKHSILIIYTHLTMIFSCFLTSILVLKDCFVVYGYLHGRNNLGNDKELNAMTFNTFYSFSDHLLNVDKEQKKDNSYSVLTMNGSEKKDTNDDILDTLLSDAINQIAVTNNDDDDKYDYKDVGLYDDNNEDPQEVEATFTTSSSQTITDYSICTTKDTYLYVSSITSTVSGSNVITILVEYTAEINIMSSAKYYLDIYHSSWGKVYSAKGNFGQTLSKGEGEILFTTKIPSNLPSGTYTYKAWLKQKGTILTCISQKINR